MAGRKPSLDPASQMAVYPSRSLRERIEARAKAAGEKPAQYIVEAARGRVEREERKAARDAKS